MKIRIIFLILLLLSSKAFSWECKDGSASGDDIGVHLVAASDVYLGRVVSGEYVSGEIDFTLKVHNVIKGNREKFVQLATSHHELASGIGLGENYVVFLYGGKRLDFCGELIQVSPNIETIGDLFGTENPREAAVIEFYKKHNFISQ